MTIAVFLRRYRDAKGLSGRGLATLIGLDYYRLQKWENGKGAPKAEDVEKIKSYFKLQRVHDIEEEVLNNRISGFINPDVDIPVSVLLQEKDELLAEKEKRIVELNRMVNLLEESLAEYKVGKGKSKR